MATTSGNPLGHGFLLGGGEMARLIAGFDWSRTPLGSLIDWPEPIKTTVGLILRSPVPIVTLWGDAGIMIYNDSYSRFAGRRHPNILGAAVRRGWPEAADFNDNVMKVGLAGGSLSYTDQEFVLDRGPTAERVTLNLDYSPVLDETGRAIGIIAIVVETTEAVDASRKLRENEARLTFLDALGKETAKSNDADSILATTTRMVGEHLQVTSCAYADMDQDQNGFTIRGDWAAPGAMHIVGHYRLADFGKLAVERLSAGLPLVINDNLTEIAPEEAATFQAIGIGATICMPLVKEGRLTALMAIHHRTAHQWTENELATIREVTERSWAHIERVRSEADRLAQERVFRDELERKVLERTAELQASERALQQAQKMEAIGNLTGGIAHDFNNLLMTVLGSLELLRKRIPQDERLLRLVDNASAGALRGKSLIERMLAFARRQDLRPERVSLHDLLDGMSDLLQRSLGPTIRLVVEVPDDLPLVEIDPNQMEAAILNLSLNARDAMSGQGPLHITAHVSEAGLGDNVALGQYVCLVVSDEGEGMDEATLKRATEPFFTTKGVGKGTGLGLSMVHGLAEQSGGQLKLRSTPRLGTAAEIWLPARGRGSADSPRGAVKVAKGAVSSNSLRVLVVDDDPLVLGHTAEMLEDLGHSVVSVASGADALDVLQVGRFDLLLTDYAMPLMTGGRLIQKVSAKYPDLAVIVATGFADMPSDLATVARLRKPYDQSELSEMIDKARHRHL